MKRISKDELFNHVSGFLQQRGVVLQAGSYTEGIQKGCEVLAKAVNLGQKGVKSAQGKLSQVADQVRQSIHEHTAPPPPKPKAKARRRKPATRQPKPAAR